jgi:hypothetical protein
MRTMIVAFVMPFVLMVSSCHERDVHKTMPMYGITDDCMLVLKGEDDSATEATNIVLNATTLVRWCNESSNYVTLKSDDRRVLGGRASIRLTPGQCILLRVLSGTGEWELEWDCWSIDPDGNREEKGGGGSPGMTDEPPDDD